MRSHICRRSRAYFAVALMTVVLAPALAPTESVIAAGVKREVVEGITTQRIIQGEPYELAGRRLVFLNWYFIRPGCDADWRKSDGQSVRVRGSAGPWEGRFNSVGQIRDVHSMVVGRPADRPAPPRHSKLLDGHRPPLHRTERDRRFPTLSRLAEDP